MLLKQTLFMLTERIKRFLLAVAVISNCCYIYARMTHLQSLSIIWYVNIIITIIMAAICIYEVLKSTSIQLPEKILWSIGFACIGIIVIGAYFIRARKRIYNIQ